MDKTGKSTRLFAASLLFALIIFSFFVQPAYGQEELEAFKEPSYGRCSKANPFFKNVLQRPITDPNWYYLGDGVYAKYNEFKETADLRVFRFDLANLTFKEETGKNLRLYSDRAAGTYQIMDPDGNITAERVLVSSGVYEDSVGYVYDEDGNVLQFRSMQMGAEGNVLNSSDYTFTYKDGLIDTYKTVLRDANGNFVSAYQYSDYQYAAGIPSGTDPADTINYATGFAKVILDNNGNVPAYAGTQIYAIARDPANDYRITGQTIEYKNCLGDTTGYEIKTNAYDGAGNLTGYSLINKAADGTTTMAQTDYVITYNETGQKLTQAETIKDPVTGDPYKTTSYTYSGWDPAGNPIDFVQTITDPADPDNPISEIVFHREFNSFGQVVYESETLPGETTPYKITEAYEDSTAWRTNLDGTTCATILATKAFDSSGQLTSLTYGYMSLDEANLTTQQVGYNSYVPRRDLNGDVILDPDTGEPLLTEVGGAYGGYVNLDQYGHYTMQIQQIYHIVGGGYFYDGIYIYDYTRDINGNILTQVKSEMNPNTGFLTAQYQSEYTLDSYGHVAGFTNQKLEDPIMDWNTGTYTWTSTTSSTETYSGVSPVTGQASAVTKEYYLDPAKTQPKGTAILTGQTYDLVTGNLVSYHYVEKDASGAIMQESDWTAGQAEPIFTYASL